MCVNQIESRVRLRRSHPKMFGHYLVDDAMLELKANKPIHGGSSDQDDTTGRLQPRCFGTSWRDDRLAPRWLQVVPAVAVEFAGDGGVETPGLDEVVVRFAGGSCYYEFMKTSVS
jgi:hypothetical protein